MIPAKLRRGDEVRIVSPAVSLGFIPEEQKQIARERLEPLGLRLSFSENAEAMDRFDSSPVEARVSDLHEAFVDPRVKAILTTLGAYNSRRDSSRSRSRSMRCMTSSPMLPSSRILTSLSRWAPSSSVMRRW
jgi:hypothetical protein